MTLRKIDKDMIDPSFKQEIDTEIQQVATQLAQKVGQNELSNAITPKADKSYVEMELGKKANASDLAIKADKEYVDIKTASIASGSPKGVYTTLTALQNAFPSGNSNIYLVETDGNWYFWNVTKWQSGGKYQNALGELSDVLLLKDELKNDKFTIMNLTSNKALWSSIRYGILFEVKESVILESFDIAYSNIRTDTAVDDAKFRVRIYEVDSITNLQTILLYDYTYSQAMNEITPNSTNTYSINFPFKKGKKYSIIGTTDTIWIWKRESPANPTAGQHVSSYINAYSRYNSADGTIDLTHDYHFFRNFKFNKSKLLMNEVAFPKFNLQSEVHTDLPKTFEMNKLILLI